jgi:antitoxin ParD1/3/4
MAMTSLNISLPEALKEYVEGQVASSDWRTPSEYVRELIRQDKERRLSNLEQDLITAAKSPKIELSVTEIRKKGLAAALRERTRRGEATANYSKRCSSCRYSKLRNSSYHCGGAVLSSTLSAALRVACADLLTTFLVPCLIFRPVFLTALPVA